MNLSEQMRGVGRSTLGLDDPNRPDPDPLVGERIVAHLEQMALERFPFPTFLSVVSTCQAIEAHDVALVRVTLDALTELAVLDDGDSRGWFLAFDQWLAVVLRAPDFEALVDDAVARIQHSDRIGVLSAFGAVCAAYPDAALAANPRWAVWGMLVHACAAAGDTSRARDLLDAWDRAGQLVDVGRVLARLAVQHRWPLADLEIVLGGVLA